MTPLIGKNILAFHPTTPSSWSIERGFELNQRPSMAINFTYVASKALRMQEHLLVWSQGTIETTECICKTRIFHNDP